jgi:hypothetical protein
MNEMGTRRARSWHPRTKNDDVYVTSVHPAVPHFSKQSASEYRYRTSTMTGSDRSETASGWIAGLFVSENNASSRSKELAFWMIGRILRFV